MRNAMHREILAGAGEVRVFHVEIPGTSLLPAAPDPHCDVHVLPRIRALSLSPILSVGDLLFDAKIAQALRHVMQSFRPTVVVMEEPWLHRYIPIVKAFPCTLIVDFHNVEAYVYADIAKQQGLSWGERLRARHMLRSARRAEQDCIEAAQSIWTCSEEDANRCRSLYATTPAISVIPNGIECNRYAQCRRERPSKEAASLLLCGNFFYFPNKQAAECAIDEILPLVRREIPETRLLLVGQKPSRRMLDRAAHDDRIIVTGAVEDVRPCLTEASLSIIPLSIGGGTRLKILEAIAAGCPVITTTKGREGLDLSDEEHILIADTPAAMAACILRLANDSVLAKRLAGAALHRIEQQYSREAIAPKMHDALHSYNSTPSIA
jgi:polysaccharide biosynthesis protein PslH